MSPKFCIDCEHHDEHPFFGHHCFSKHRDKDPVTGTVHGRKCADERKDETGCGPDGKHYEPRRLRWWQRGRASAALEPRP